MFQDIIYGKRIRYIQPVPWICDKMSVLPKQEKQKFSSLFAGSFFGRSRITYSDFDISGTRTTEKTADRCQKTSKKTTLLTKLRMIETEFLHQKSCPNMYETLQIMRYLLYQLVGRIFFHLSFGIFRSRPSTHQHSVWYVLLGSVFLLHLPSSK